MSVVASLLTKTPVSVFGTDGQSDLWSLCEALHSVKGKKNRKNRLETYLNSIQPRRVVLKERKEEDFEKVCYLPTHFIYLCCFFILYKIYNLEKEWR